jgi:hypothetical protein
MTPSGTRGAEYLCDSHRRCGLAIGSVLGRQAISRALFDQQVDQRHPALLVDSIRQQLPIAIVVEFLTLLTHATPPPRLIRYAVREPFRNPEVGATAIGTGAGLIPSGRLHSDAPCKTPLEAAAAARRITRPC